jgi:hypothetical protein
MIREAEGGGRGEEAEAEDDDEADDRIVGLWVEG